jgi:hypothetical protein
MGHGLLTTLAGADRRMITLDLNRLDPSLAPLVTREFIGSVTDASLLDRVLAEFEVDCVFHLAALLSARAEFTPTTAHHVNVEGTLNLLEFAQKQGESHGRTVTFVYPSSIAAYGLPSLAAKMAAGRSGKASIRIRPRCGCNKLYCEELGRYYTRHYNSSPWTHGAVDFRAVRFPADFGDHHAVRRDVGLCAGNGARGGARAGLRLFRAAGYDDSVHGDAGRLRRAGAPVGGAREPDADGVQRLRLHALCRRDPRDGPGGVPGSADHV